MEDNVPKEEGITIAVKDATGEQTHFKVIGLLGISFILVCNSFRDWRNPEMY